MKIIHEKPNIYDRLKERFNIDWDDGIIITYGEHVYCKFALPPEKIIHEEVHTNQQKESPNEWWNKYIDDPKFRLDQEIEAYLAEAKFIKKTVKDREKSFRLIRNICIDISSPIYGGIITYEKAWEILYNPNQWIQSIKKNDGL